jgi:L-asparaginase II
MKTEPENGAAVVVKRGACVENTHLAHIAVVEESGNILYSYGDAFRMTLARSAAKPLQAVAILEAGAFEKYDFDDADLALICASHNSEDRHVERAKSMLKKIDAEESDLQCGGHDPVSISVYKDWIKRDITPTAVCNNCSGKHVGMLAATKALGAEVSSYNQPTHPIQLSVKKVVAELCDLPIDDVEWAIDGCNLPTPAFPLFKLGAVYAKLAGAADDILQDKINVEPRRRALARIFSSMVQFPEMVAGEDRFCTTLMRAFDGMVVGKLGADGCYGIGIRAGSATERLGARGAIGVAVKVEDGSIDVLYSVVSEVLAQLEIGTLDQRQQLSKYHQPKKDNTKGIEVGSTHFTFNLKS